MVENAFRRSTNNRLTVTKCVLRVLLSAASSICVVGKIIGMCFGEIFIWSPLFSIKIMKFPLGPDKI